MSVNFIRRIQWPNNKDPLPFNLYGGKWVPENLSQFDPTTLTDDPRFDPNQSFPKLLGVQIPTGLSRDHVRAPRFVTATRLQQLAGPHTGPTLRVVHGLVVPSLEVHFASVQKQWRRISATGGQSAQHGPCQFQFLGGDVLLDLILTIYLEDRYTPQPRDPISVELFATVYSHELLHVLDEIDIFTVWLPTRLRTEPSVLRYLVQAQPYTYGGYRQPIHQVEQQFRHHISTYIRDNIRHLCAAESNRRVALRDAPAAYQIVQQQIDRLRRWQQNPSTRHLIR